MKGKRIIVLIILLNLIIIVVLGGFLLKESLNIEYKNFKNSLDIKIFSEGNYPYLFKTQNESILLVFSKFDKINDNPNSSWEVFYSSSKDTRIWSKYQKLTNDSYLNKHPLLIQHNESTIRLFYYSLISKKIGEWYYKESQDLINWTLPKICNQPSIENNIWSEIDVPDYFKNAKKYKGQYSLIKNSNGKYMLIGIHDESSSIEHPNLTLFITTSNNGKDWEIPIKIVDETISDPYYSFIENGKGNYTLVFHSYENFKNVIKIVNFSNSDLENTTNIIPIYYLDNIILGSALSLFLIIFLNLTIYLILSKIKKRKSFTS